MVFNPNNIDIGSAVVTYKFPLGVALPKIGETLEDGDYTMTVLDSNVKDNSIQVIVTRSGENADNRLIEFLEKLDKAEEAIAESLYKDMSGAIMSYIGWDNLPPKDKDKYKECTKKVINYLNDERLLSLKY